MLKESLLGDSLKKKSFQGVLFFHNKKESGYYIFLKRCLICFQSQGKSSQYKEFLFLLLDGFFFFQFHGQKTQQLNCLENQKSGFLDQEALLLILSLIFRFRFYCALKGAEEKYFFLCIFLSFWKLRFSRQRRNQYP